MGAQLLRDMQSCVRQARRKARSAKLYRVAGGDKEDGTAAAASEHHSDALKPTYLSIRWLQHHLRPSRAAGHLQLCGYACAISEG